MYVWSRVPCSRERELGGPYHWGCVSLGDHTIGGGPGIRSPDSCIYIYIQIHIYADLCLMFGNEGFNSMGLSLSLEPFRLKYGFEKTLDTPRLFHFSVRSLKLG